MPYHFFQHLFERLEEVGREGATETWRKTDLPFLSWLVDSGRLFIGVGAIAIVIYGLVTAFRTGRYAFTSAIGAFVLSILFAFLFTWASGLLLELFGIWITLVNNTSRILRNLEKEEDGQNNE
jgi:hypothetical protein